jgi:2,3-bisphosphoglycerate-independent phosphoglycerate mutase
MDRDNRWHREKKAYEAIVNGKGDFYPDFKTAIQESYNKGVTDEFIKAVVLNKQGVVKSDDGLIFFNFRSDRARQITKAFVEYGFKGFKRKKINNLHFLSLTQYSSDLDVEVAFPIIDIKNTLGDIISKQGFKQLRIAETEKYAHVTYFFNGLRENILDGETRILIPSPKVSTYDLKPEMSIHKINKTILEAINNELFDFIVLNFANEDMVGHTGNFDASVKACEAVDKSLGLILNAIKEKSGTLIITADHGNVETMIDHKTKQKNTAHTTNKVRFIIVSNHIRIRNAKLKKGNLADVAPTILDIMHIKKPFDMTGKNLIKNKNI